MLTHLQDSQCIPLAYAEEQYMKKYEERRKRNEGEDMQRAIGLLYEFKAKLDELHPKCAEFIENMLQRPRY